MHEQHEQPRKRRRRRTRTPLTAGLCIVAASVMGAGLVADAVGTADTSSTTSADPEVFKGIEPLRLLDTRRGIGASAAGAFGPGETRTLVVAGVEEVPWTATSVAINVTLSTSETSTSYVTMWPTGSTQLDTSTSNATPGQAVPNFAIVALGDGAMDVSNEAGDTHIVIDIVGYYIPMPSGDAAGSFRGALFNGIGEPTDVG